MRYLLAQPASLRFQWELDVVLTNIYSLDEDADICVLFALVDRESPDVVKHIRSRYPRAEVQAYNDARPDKSYPPTIRPYLWHRYLTEDPAREQETYFQIDSDVIFRQLPDFSQIPFSETVWYGSDCGGYIDYQYLKTRKNGEEIVDNFAKIIGVDRSVIKDTPGAGAQWVLVKPTAQYWLKVYHDSQALHDYLKGVDSDIQKWTAEMWAQLYAAPYLGIEMKTHPELDFCRPTDDIKMWDMVKILHNAGVTKDMKDFLFYKGKYVRNLPLGRDYNWVRRDKAGWHYAQALAAIKP